MKKVENSCCKRLVLFFGKQTRLLNHYPVLFDYGLWNHLVSKNCSLHWIISLSFSSFWYNGVCYSWFKLSVNDIIVSQKKFHYEKLQFFGRDSKVKERYFIVQKGIK